jgi:hypothetical protein
VKDSPEFDFIVESLAEEREYPNAQLTGWETIVFELQEDEEPLPSR